MCLCLRKISTATIFLLTIGHGTVRGDRYLPILNFSVDNPGGNYYVAFTISNDDTKDSGKSPETDFQIACRTQFNQMRFYQNLDQTEWWHRTAQSSIAKGDRVVATGKLGFCPKLVAVSSSGLGFGSADNVKDNADLRDTKKAIVFIDLHGNVIVQKSLRDLFDDTEIMAFSRTPGRVTWARCCWIDEINKRFVLVTHPMEKREAGHNDGIMVSVNLHDGTVIRSNSTQLVLALEQRNKGALRNVLELLLETSDVKANTLVSSILNDGDQPTSVKVRAALALAKYGDKQGKHYIERLALEHSVDQRFIVRNLYAIGVDESLNLLQRLLQNKGQELDLDIEASLVRLPRITVVNWLVALVKNGESDFIVDFAVRKLAKYGNESKAAVPVLVDLLKSGKISDSAAQNIAFTLGRIGPPAEEALPLLIQFVEKTAPEEWQLIKRRRFSKLVDGSYSTNHVIEAICRIKE